MCRVCRAKNWTHVPSSLPLLEAGPLILWVVGYMPEPIEYSEADEKDRRLSLSGRRSVRVREDSRVGVRESESSIAEDAWGSVRVSSKLVSSALESRREGNCLGTALEAGGGMEMLARTALASLVSSDARPFLLAADDCNNTGARVLSVLTVRFSSIPAIVPELRRSALGSEALCHDVVRR